MHPINAKCWSHHQNRFFDPVILVMQCNGPYYVWSMDKFGVTNFACMWPRCHWASTLCIILFHIITVTSMESMSWMDFANVTPLGPNLVTWPLQVSSTRKTHSLGAIYHAATVAPSSNTLGMSKTGCSQNSILSSRCKIQRSTCICIWISRCIPSWLKSWP